MNITKPNAQKSVKKKKKKENLNLKIINIVQKQLNLKTNHLEKNNTNVDNLRENHKEFIKTIK